MAFEIHAQTSTDTSAPTLYRLWSTVTDSYATEPLDEEEVREQLRTMYAGDAMRDYERNVEGIHERLVRARHRGTSSRVTERDPAGPWATERCGGHFHHAFVERPGSHGAYCAQCGEPPGAVAHGPPCGDDAAGG